MNEQKILIWKERDGKSLEDFLKDAKWEYKRVIGIACVVPTAYKNEFGEANNSILRLRVITEAIVILNIQNEL